MSYVFDSMKNFNDKIDILNSDTESIKSWNSVRDSKLKTGETFEPNDDDSKNCSLVDTYKNSIMNNSAEINKVIDYCKRRRYPNSTKEMTLKELLNLIKIQPKNEVTSIIEQFPHQGSKGITNTDSHVFEALWILIFLFKYDDLRDDNQTRLFYEKLETMKTNKLSIRKILEETNVNSSNKGGIADIFFEHIDNPKGSEDLEKEAKNKITCRNGETIVLPSCENDFSKDKNKKFLFSAKYYLKEKGISHYDIQDIFLEGVERLNEFNILLLIKDKKSLMKKILRSKKAHTKRFYKIMDITDLNIYYKKLKADLDSNSLEDFITYKSQRKDITQLSPRFHQQYFIDYSLEQINRGNLKLIWGAVPRSGKSYMIAGLISQYKPNQVVIFLGAISETLTQFMDMFNKYEDFTEYEIINVQKVGYNIDPLKKNIILISQQKGWIDSKKKKTDELLLEVLKEKNKLIFFDEIHQGAGGGSQKSQETLLDRYIFNKKVLESPFIMVTATFAKPMLNYGKNKGGIDSKLIQWKYEDIQLMKEIDKPNILDNLLDTIENDSKDHEDGVLKSQLFHNLVESQERQGITLEHLAKQYYKYPELVVMCPGLENEDTKQFKNLFTQEKTIIDRDIICNSVFKIKGTKFNEEFKNQDATEEFIGYIIKNVYDTLLKRFGFNVFGKTHSQLWFLPTSCQSTQKLLMNHFQ